MYECLLNNKLINALFIVPGDLNHFLGLDNQLCTPTDVSRTPPPGAWETSPRRPARTSPRRLPGAPKTPPRRLQTPPDASKAPRGASKMLPSHLQAPPRAPKTPPRRFQESFLDIYFLSLPEALIKKRGGTKAQPSHNYFTSSWNYDSLFCFF